MEPVISRTEISLPVSRIPLRRKILALVVIAGTCLGISYNQTRQILYPVLREAIRVSAIIETWNWPKLESEHFSVRYEPKTGEAEMAKLVLENAEEIYGPVVQAFGYPIDKKVVVVLYPTRSAMGKTFGWDADESAMGVYWGGVIRVLSPEQWIPKQEQANIKTVFASSGPMAHELTHLVVDYRTGGNYTRWLTEGIAQYKEREVTGFQFDEPGAQMDQVPYRLAQMDGDFDNLPNQALAYRQSLLAVDYLASKYGKEKINLLLDQLGKGDTTEQAFQKVYGVNLATFEQQLNQWMQQL